MKDDKDEREGHAATNSRRDRLKLALRENLKRRKSQARERGDMTAPPPDDVGVSRHDGRGKKPGE